MKKLLLATAVAVALSGAGFSQMMGGMMGQQGGMMGQPQMFMPMMGMMQDPETMKIVQEHMMKCRKELMQKLAKKHNMMAERMLYMMTMHPDAFKEALKKNPELKKKLKELLK